MTETPATTKPRPDFNELGRITSGHYSSTVVSTVARDGRIEGYTVNKFTQGRSEEDFTGFSKGSFIPVEEIPEFLGLFGKKNLLDALDELGDD